MSRKRKDPAEGPDQLGTLPPDTLCLSLFSKFPYMPSRVLSRRQALAQTALKGEVDKLVAGTLKGCCVLFFGAAKTVAVIAATDIEPYLVHGCVASLPRRCLRVAWRSLFLFRYGTLWESASVRQ